MTAVAIPVRRDSRVVASPAGGHRAVIVNDVHAQFNATVVAGVERPRTTADVQEALHIAASRGQVVSVSGGKHAMGGQQFATGGMLLDMRGMDRVISLDSDRGLVEVEAGIQWPALIESLHLLQGPGPDTWSIAQKQTGADRLTIGGAIAANVHGRGLAMRPFVSDLESFTLVGADGVARPCSRAENADLFGLATGGYGLFGVVTKATLRLVRRQKLERVVEVMDVDAVNRAFEQRIADGFLYGDFQFAIDGASPSFLRRGVFSCYRPVRPDTPIPPGQRVLGEDSWRQLLHLAHFDKARAFDAYAAHYLSTNGQIYWSDTHQLSAYLDDYHREIDTHAGSPCRGTELITEVYVPRPRLADFMAAVGDDFRRTSVNCIYGTVRLIERDEESFLPWASDRWACVIFNLHADHDLPGICASADAFRRLIDRALERGGSYYLTYHRYARKDQLLACYPQFPEFLRRKREHDPEELFQSDWYRHYRRMFADD